MILIVGIILNTGLTRSTVIIVHLAAFARHPARRLNLQLRLREVILPGSLSYDFRPLLPQILFDLEVRFQVQILETFIVTDSACAQVIIRGGGLVERLQLVLQVNILSV